MQMNLFQRIIKIRRKEVMSKRENEKITIEADLNKTASVNYTEAVLLF